MIRITDMTLSCIEAFRSSCEQLKLLYKLLNNVGADFIEMPVSVYEQIKPETTEKVVLRMATPDEAADFPEISRFVCRKNGFDSTPSIMREIQINDIKEISLLGQNEQLQNIRIVGLDDVLCHDFESAFSNIKKRIIGHVEFCPENSYSCATASAMEWIAAGGTDIAAAFGGIDGKAALEEVLLSLRVVRRHKPNASFGVMPQIAALMEDITASRFSDRKAVIGRKIFNVESGIHVDGILKKPQMYEPYLPELVGSSRRFVVGKHSGRKSIAAKLAELGYSPLGFDIARILLNVREESISNMSSLTDEEFVKIALRFRL
jgi:homocitrate synthase NifV